jgi:hypothetical protein
MASFYVLFPIQMKTGEKMSTLVTIIIAPYDLNNKTINVGDDRWRLLDNDRCCCTIGAHTNDRKWSLWNIEKARRRNM